MHLSIKLNNIKSRLGYFSTTISADRSSILSIYFLHLTHCIALIYCVHYFINTALVRGSGNGGFFPRQSVGYPWCKGASKANFAFIFKLFLFPITLERSRPIFSNLQFDSSRSFLTHFIIFQTSVFRFVPAHFEPLHCDLLVPSRDSLSALIILLTIPTKATRGRVLNFHSILLQLPHLTRSPDSQNVSSPCQLYERFRASARVLTRKIRAQKHVL